MNSRKLALSAAAAAVLTLGVLAPSAGAATCTPASNIEAIVDDSGSMASTDFNTLRSEGLKLLMAKSGNAKKQLGAVEFGSGSLFPGDPPAAATLFPPRPIGPNIAANTAALDAAIKADQGSTDYNAAFAQAKTDNPAANARIFITDGGHNEGEYTNGHQGGPPTYVIGLGIGVLSPTDPDATRLQTIASETGGIYYPSVTSSNIQATINQIDAALDCQKIGKTFSDIFTRAGQVKAKKLNVSSKTRTIDLTLTWATPDSKFTIGSFKLKPRGKRAFKPKVKIVNGRTFVNVRLTKLKKGRLSFRLRSKTLGSSFGGVNLTTQAVPSTRR